MQTFFSAEQVRESQRHRDGKLDTVANMHLLYQYRHVVLDRLLLDPETAADFAIGVAASNATQHGHFALCQRR